MTDEPHHAAPSAVDIARRHAIDAVLARLEEISRLASSAAFVAPEQVAGEPGRDAERRRNVG